MVRKYVRGRTRAEVSRKFDALRQEAAEGLPDGTTTAKYLAGRVAGSRGSEPAADDAPAVCPPRRKLLDARDRPSRARQADAIRCRAGDGRARRRAGCC